MGSSGHSTPSRERRGVKHITWYSPGNSQNQEFSQELCLVAQNGHEFRREGEKLCYLSESPKKAPPCSPLHPWGWPGRPWSRVHIDYAGPFMGKMFLLIIDAHSKWMDIHCVNSATSSVTIDKTRSTFASHVLPETVVSDNGSNFVSSEFKSFLQKNGIKYKLSKCGPGSIPDSVSYGPYGPGSIPDSASYVGWVCWFSTLHREVFLRVLRFSPLLSLKTKIWFDLR